MRHAEISTKERKERRHVVAVGLAAVGAAAASLVARATVAEAAHDGTDVLHVGELNQGGTDPTRLQADVAISALGGPGPGGPPAATLMISNTGGPGAGFAIFAHANPGAAGGVNGNASSTVGVLGTTNTGTGVRGSGVSGAGVHGSSGSGPGVRGTSNDGPGVEALSPAATSPALVAQWTGDPSSPTPHSGIFGSTVAFAAPGIHGQAPQMGVLGRSGPPNGGEPLGNGIGVRGQSGTGVGVQGMSSMVGVVGLAMAAGPGQQLTNGTGVHGESGGGAGVLGKSASGPGVRGESASGPGVQGIANGTNPGVVGASTGPMAGVNGHTSAGGPGLHGISQGGGPAVLATSSAGGLALDVEGRARFSVAGVAVIPENAMATEVPAPVNPATSLVLITPLGSTARHVVWVEIGSGSFTIHLDDRRHASIPVAWLAIERP